MWSNHFAGIKCFVQSRKRQDETHARLFHCSFYWCFVSRFVLEIVYWNGPLRLVLCQWPVSMHYFQNKSADKASMKWTIKQLPRCISFTLTFPRLGKAFNYCKIIGSHARWWNDLVLSGDFIPFHRVGDNARGVSLWWNYFLLSSSFHAKSTVFLTWRSNKCAWHSGETPTETDLIQKL